MERFHVIEDAAVILRTKGVYRQAKIYRRGAELFAGVGSGFIGLRARGGTSHLNISWLEIDAGCAIVEPTLGLIQIKGATVAKLGSAK